MFNPGRNSTLCFAALFWAPAFGIGCHRSLTPDWGHSCPGHPQLWPFGDSDLFFQISLLLLLLFLFLTKSCCGNQKMVWTWKRTHTGPHFLRPSSAPQPAHLGASVGGGGTWSHEACALRCLLWGTAAQGFPSPKTSFRSFSPLPAGTSAQPFPAELRSSL